MKVLGGSHYLFPDAGITADVLIRFALSQPIQVAIVGCSTPEHVQTLAHAAKGLQPMTAEEMEHLTTAFRPHAGRLAFYLGVF